MVTELISRGSRLLMTGPACGGLQVCTWVPPSCRADVNVLRGPRPEAADSSGAAGPTGFAVQGGRHCRAPRKSTGVWAPVL